MADRNMELRRANYKQKNQYNAADVSCILCWLIKSVACRSDLSLTFFLAPETS